MEEKNESAIESEIRGRVRNALADFAVLSEHADPELKRSIIKRTEDNPMLGNQEHMDHALHGLVQFSLEMSGDEEFADVCMGVAEDAQAGGLMDEVEDVLSNSEALYRGNYIPLLRNLCSLIGDFFKDRNTSISKREAIKVFSQHWPNK